ncbi:MAG: HEAT repeat domain-containing protein [Planctomycetes bacterium]|nr:HEAT repeat domain-containing protein [Planctomycetota bacterium]
MSRDKPGADLGYWLQCLRVADPFQRVHAAMVLGLMGEQAQGAIPALVDALRDEDVQVRRMITAALGEIGPPSRTAVPVLVNSLRDRNEVVRTRAAIALSEMGPAARVAVPGLTAALKDHCLGVRRWATFALGEIGPKAAAAAPELLELFRDPSIITRTLALVALRKIGPSALSVLIPSLKDPHAGVRRLVASVLGRCATQTDLLTPVLREATADPDPSVRESVLEALQRLTANASAQPPAGGDPIAPSLLPVD